MQTIPRFALATQVAFWGSDPDLGQFADFSGPGGLLGTLVVNSGNSDTPFFMGFEDANGISQVVVNAVLIGGGPLFAFRMGIDDVQFGTPVPEPSTGLLLATGPILLAASRRPGGFGLALGCVKALRNRALLALLVAQVFLGPVDPSMADTIVAPAIPPAPIAGGNVAPFGLQQPVHYQQVYGASVFGGPALIESIAFYLPVGSGTYVADNLVVSLGHTLAPVDGLAFPLDSNVNGTLQVMLSATQFTQSLQVGAFSLIFDFSSDPFLFDPNQGNLLLDVHLTDNNLTDQLGPWAFAGRSEADLTSRSYQDLSANSDSFGLSTRFVFAPTVIPEPATALLVASGLAMIGIFSRRGPRSLVPRSARRA